MNPIAKNPNAANVSVNWSEMVAAMPIAVLFNALRRAFSRPSMIGAALATSAAAR
jgi:hypothetical protein